VCRTGASVPSALTMYLAGYSRAAPPSTRTVTSEGSLVGSPQRDDHGGHIEAVQVDDAEHGLPIEPNSAASYASSSRYLGRKAKTVASLFEVDRTAV
jgi:hypothetical protein